MSNIYKLYGIIEPVPGTIYIPWFWHSETTRAHGDLKVTEGHEWFPFARWAMEHRDTLRLIHMFHEEDMGKILEAFTRALPSSWDELLERAGVE